jgi:hypothetical protein
MSPVKKVLALAGTLGVALSGVYMAASAASANTLACDNVTGTDAGYCGSEVNMYANAFDVRYQGAWVNNVVEAYPGNTADKAQDFVARQTTGNPDERVFFYAPNGVRAKDSKTGAYLVIADPAGGVPGDSRDGLVLRDFVGIQGSAYQQFTGVSTQNTAGTTWTNVATKQIVIPQGTGNQLITAANPTSRGMYWGWDQPGVDPA